MNRISLRMPAAGALLSAHCYRPPCHCGASRGEAAGAGGRPVRGRQARLFFCRRQVCRRARQGHHGGQTYVEVLAPKTQRRPLPGSCSSMAPRRPRPTGWERPTAARAGLGTSSSRATPALDESDQRDARTPRPCIRATARRGCSRRRTSSVQFTAIESDGTWPGREKHTQWPGSGPNKGKKGDPTFDAFYATQVETVISPEVTQEPTGRGASAAVDKIGPRNHPHPSRSPGRSAG